MISDSPLAATSSAGTLQRSKTFGLLQRMKPSNVMLVRAMLFVGVLLRLRLFLFNRSLWIDECLLALNLLTRSPAELIKPLTYHQGAPLGFLMMEKGSILLFGTSELALRLVPFLAGIASLFLFAQVAKRFVSPNAVPIAVGFFAISGPLIYFSSEAKQYSTDVAVALTLFLIGDSLLRTGVRPLRALLFSFFAAVLLWFSQPAAFAVAAIGITWLVCAIGERDQAALVRALAFGAITSASFGLSFFVSLRKLSHDEWLLGYWNGAFLPLHLFSSETIRWLIATWFNILETPAGLTSVGIATAAIVIGAKDMFRDNRKNWLLLVLPIGFALLASGFHRYPFRGRLLLFAVPSLLLLVAFGLSAIRWRSREVVPGLGVLLIGLLFLLPAEDAFRNFLRPRGVEETRPALAFVEKQFQPGDTLYCYYDAEPALKYYTLRGTIRSIPTTIGVESRNNWVAYPQDLNRLRGKERVWILFSHVYRDGGADEELLFLNYLNQIGKRKSEMHATGSAAYLYDLSNP